jgi:hypothetical protein
MLAIVNAEDASSDTALIQGSGRCGETAQGMAVLLTDSTCMNSDAFYACFRGSVGCTPGVLLLIQMMTWQISKKAMLLHSSDMLSRALNLKMEWRCARLTFATLASTRA